MKKFAVFDIDGTLIRWQLYHAIVDQLAKLGFVDAKQLKPIHDARLTWKRREGEESFKQYEKVLIKVYDELLTTVMVDQFEAAAQAVFDEYKDQVYTYTRDLIKHLKSKGYLLFAVSGSQEQAISKLADYYGFDDFVAKVDEQAGLKFTGKGTTPVHDKDKHLKMLVEKHGAGFKGSVAVGDSSSDVAMLELVEQPIAFNPEQKLLDHAKAKGWPIVVERKNVIYELKADGPDYHLN